MAIQIRGSQVQDATLTPGKLDLTQSYDYSSGTVSVATPTAAAHAATKAYVDGLIPDGFVGGNGIVITDGTPNDTIAVDLATDAGMLFIGAGSDKLAVKVKAETGGSITRDADGIYIADNAIGNAKLAGSIANAKLANSTISGISLGSNLNSLSAGNGLSMTSYNGSAAVSDLTIDLDGTTLAVGLGGIKVADAGVDTTQIADGAVSAAKVGFEAGVDFFSPNGSTAAFALAAEVPSDFFGMVLAYKNGLLMKQVAATPADADEYTVSTSLGVTSVTFGANLSSSDTLDVRSFQIKP